MVTGLRTETFLGEPPYFLISLAAKERSLAALLDISGFLYNVNLVYEIARLATDRKYDKYTFSTTSFYAGRRPLKPNDRLRVVRLSSESPLDLLAYLPGEITAAGAVFALALAVARIAKGSVDLAKTVSEIRKLTAERRKLDAEARKFDAEAHKLESETRRNEAEARRLEREIPDQRQLPEQDQMRVLEPETWVVTPERTIIAAPFTTEKRLEQRLSRREALTWFNRASNRLGRSGVEIESFRVEVATDPTHIR